MQLGSTGRRRIQALLLVLIVAAAIRLLLIYRERHQPPASAPRQQAALNPEYYVSPKKLYAYDLKSARQLTKQPAWVKEGYKYVYYPYDPAQHRSDFKHEAGRLGPIERLQIKEIVLDASPGSPDQHQIMAVFQKDGKWFAFPVGAERGGDYQLYIDEILYIEDPRELYSFWSKNVWQTIDRHQVKPGMDELQAMFALGVGLLQSPAGSGDRVLRYPDDGHPVVVTFRDGKAVDIKPA